MRTLLVTSLLLFAPASLAAEPQTSAPGSHCAATGAKGQELIAVSVNGNFKACLLALMEGAKKKCANEPELKLTVTGSEFGKEAEPRVLRIDCPTDGGKIVRPLPPGMAPKK